MAFNPNSNIKETVSGELSGYSACAGESPGVLRDARILKKLVFI
jgi:hypothetical protein